MLLLILIVLDFVVDMLLLLTVIAFVVDIFWSWWCWLLYKYCCCWFGKVHVFQASYNVEEKM